MTENTPHPTAERLPPRDHDDAAVHYDVAANERVSEATVAAVAAAAGRDPLDIEPLYGAIDPEALDELTQPHSPQHSPSLVEFGYCGYDVAVHHGRHVVVSDADT